MVVRSCDQCELSKPRVFILDSFIVLLVESIIRYTWISGMYGNGFFIRVWFGYSVLCRS